MNLRRLCLIRPLLLLIINRSTTLQSGSSSTIGLAKKMAITQHRALRTWTRSRVVSQIMDVLLIFVFKKRKQNQRTRRGSRAGGRSGGWRAGRQWAWPPFMDFLSTETGGPIAFLTVVAFLTPECTPAYTHLGSNVRIGRVWNVLLRIGRKTTCYARVRLPDPVKHDLAVQPPEHRNHEQSRPSRVLRRSQQQPQPSSSEEHRVPLEIYPARVDGVGGGRGRTHRARERKRSLNSEG